MTNTNPPRIVGTANFGPTDTRSAACWEFVGSEWQLTNLGSLVTTSQMGSLAYDINDSDTVVGSAWVDIGGGDENARPFVWRKVNEAWTVTELPLLPPERGGSGTAINENGVIVGSDEYGMCLLWEPDGNGGYQVPVELECGSPCVINNRGDILTGSALWKGGVEGFPLFELIDDDSWTTLTAKAINDSGQITGTGTYEGSTRGFLMSPCAKIDVTKSVLEHGSAGDLGLLLGPYDHVEPRLPGVRRLELEMSALMDAATVVDENVQVVCKNTSYGGTISAHLENEDTVVVEFDQALPDEDCCEITLDGMLTLGNAEVCDEEVARVRPLEGDTDRGGNVTPYDASIIKPHFGHPLDQDNFLYDFNCSGAISTGDFSQIIPRFGHWAPWCPAQ